MSINKNFENHENKINNGIQDFKGYNDFHGNDNQEITEKFEEFEIIGTDTPIKLFINKVHRFGTDAVLLSEFAAPKRRDTVCDLCTGCGIIPFLLCRDMKNSPKKIYALDINEEAVAMLKASIEYNNLYEKIIPVHEDLKNITKIPRESIDIVTVNPPYFKKSSGEEKNSPAAAAARHEILCNIDDVCRASAAVLKYGGYLKLCHIPERLSDVITAMRLYNIEPKTLTFIHSENNKEKPWLFLASGKKGGKSGVEVFFKSI